MAFVSEPARPALRYHGGKWRLAPWIISHFPAHRTYVEPYGGAASVLLRKARSHNDVYNDLDDEVVHVFRVLRDPAQAEALRHAVMLTPFSRAEFELAHEPVAESVERARRTIVRSYFGRGSDSVHGHLSPTGQLLTGLRKTRTTRAGPGLDWMNYPNAIPQFADRLRGVVLEQRDARTLLDEHDALDTLFYLDPPYVGDTRPHAGTRHATYCHELSDKAHQDMLKRLRRLSGMVVLSGYRNDHYDAALTGWHRVDRESRTDGRRARIESLWLNPAAVARGAGGTGQLFAADAQSEALAEALT